MTHKAYHWIGIQLAEAPLRITHTYGNNTIEPRRDNAKGIQPQISEQNLANPEI